MKRFLRVANLEVNDRAAQVYPHLGGPYCRQLAFSIRLGLFLVSRTERCQPVVWQAGLGRETSLTG